MTKNNGLFLHAAAILGHRGVSLLLGHSCSGKTTLSSLVSDQFSIVADDLVFAFPKPDGTWAVMDSETIEQKRAISFDSAKEALCHHEPAWPLISLIRIFAAKNTKLQRLTDIKTCEYLMDAVFEISIQSKDRRLALRKQWFSRAAAMARQYPGWRLEFSLNAEQAVAAIQQTL